MDDYGPFVVLTINMPPDDTLTSDEQLRAFAQELLIKECAAFDAAPSTERVSVNTQESVERYVWRGQKRAAWTFARYCL